MGRFGRSLGRHNEYSLVFKKDNDHSKERRKGLCFACKQPGHLKFNFPNRIKPKRVLAITKEKQERKKVYRVLVPDVNKENNYVFYITTNDTPEYQARVLIDSGSELNFIDPIIVKKKRIYPLNP
ncbi:hypothetical protein PIROE2DRAFT_12113 [Piromyces sp. E2]|nr:hypothetical protein PIROE2DRAFT_12113 [Piromyces sp. E2]|eukprot:OUM61810.1 hypothetical protein PIROE2DRAFT_12113 [Piromyces sp. E2]